MLIFSKVKDGEVSSYSLGEFSFEYLGEFSSEPCLLQNWIGLVIKT